RSKHFGLLNVPIEISGEIREISDITYKQFMNHGILFRAITWGALRHSSSASTHLVMAIQYALAVGEEAKHEGSCVNPLPMMVK
ncbi:hypothetical protein ACJMK2_032827, partial [Sinanodonta woodiana]